MSEDDKRSRADYYALKAKGYFSACEWEAFLCMVLGQIAY